MEKSISNLKKKIFKFKVISQEIELINFFNLTRDDYISFLAIGAHAILCYWVYLCFPLLILLIICKPKTGIIIALYYMWIIYDRETSSTIGRKCRSEWLRNHSWYVHMKNYFPSILIKTADLPPGRNYFIATFPHGVVPVNIISNFLTNANQIEDLFPEIDMRSIIHDLLFFIPIFREYAMFLGSHACNKSSIRNLLTSSPSKGIIIQPGGPAEVVLSTPGSIYQIHKSNRKGFIRLALETGTSLVPVFVFGEMNIYDKYLISTPKFFKKFHFPYFIFLRGRGILQNHFGWIPRQHPVVTVVGKPIDVNKIENPTSKEIDEYHERFFSSLYNLFEQYKHSCDIAGNEAQLIMI